MITYGFNQRIKDKVIEDLNTLIKTAKYRYPEMKNRLTEEEIIIICDVFYDEFDKRGKAADFPQAMDLLFSNGLFSSVGEEIKFDFKCLELNKLVLIKFFNFLKIELIMRKIEKKLKELNETKKCKIKQFKKRR